MALLVSALITCRGVWKFVRQQIRPRHHTIKVAVVNVQQVLQQSPRVAELSKKLESEFKDRQTKIGDEQKALQDELDKFKKESPTMSSKR